MWDFRNEDAQEWSAEKEQRKGARVGISEEKLLVFTVAQKPWVNFSLVLGRDAMPIQPREAGRSAKHISEIPRPPPVGERVWGCWSSSDCLVGLVSDL